MQCIRLRSRTINTGAGHQMQGWSYSKLTVKTDRICAPSPFTPPSQPVNWICPNSVPVLTAEVLNLRWNSKTADVARTPLPPYSNVLPAVNLAAALTVSMSEAAVPNVLLPLTCREAAWVLPRVVLPLTCREAAWVLPRVLSPMTCRSARIRTLPVLTMLISPPAPFASVPKI